MKRLFTQIVAVLGAATLVGLVVLWPGEAESQLAQGLAIDSEKATVERVEEGFCAGFATQKCQLATVRIESGPKSGKAVKI